jgi:predicted hotdog family 3-hydroxylacyl-ACP dehydratase
MRELTSPSSSLDRAAIARLIPHQGAMCLLARVEEWTPTAIRCSAVSHADAGNPLRRESRLSALCGIEYGLQAMAVHGALVDGAAPQPTGFLSSLRGVRVTDRDLAAIEAPLRIEAELLLRQERGFIYRFSVASDGEALVAGQAAIIIPRGAGP